MRYTTIDAQKMIEFTETLVRIQKVAELSDKTGNTDEVALQILQKMPAFLTGSDASDLTTKSYAKACYISGKHREFDYYVADYVIRAFRNVFSECAYHENVSFDELKRGYTLLDTYKLSEPNCKITDVWIRDAIYTKEGSRCHSKCVSGTTLGKDVSVNTPIRFTIDKYSGEPREFQIRISSNMTKLSYVKSLSLPANSAPYDVLMIGYHYMSKGAAERYHICAGLAKDIIRRFVDENTVYDVVYRSGNSERVTNDEDAEERLRLPLRDVERNMKAMKYKHDYIVGKLGREKSDTNRLSNLMTALDKSRAAIDRKFALDESVSW